MQMTLDDVPARRITAAEFSKILGAGVFEDERERVELIDGRIYSLALPESEGHRRTINRLTRLLTSRFPEPYIIQPQSTLFLGTFDVPQPDFVVYRSNDAFAPYVERDEVVLLIEVSESSLRRDRVVKAPLFARYALSEYWIVNVAKREVEVYSAPEDGQYGRKQTFAPHEPIVSDVFPGRPLTPAEFVLS